MHQLLSDIVGFSLLQMIRSSTQVFDPFYDSGMTRIHLGVAGAMFHLSKQVLQLSNTCFGALISSFFLFVRRWLTQFVPQDFQLLG
jgi:hypothetical protein